MGETTAIQWAHHTFNPWRGTYDPARAVLIKHSKGGDPAEWPEDLRVREFPEVSHG